jgi:hypothetical protein
MNMQGGKTVWGIGNSTHIPGGHPQEGSKMGLLGRGSYFPGLDEDDPTVVAMVTMVTAELDGTCEISDR